MTLHDQGRRYVFRDGAFVWSHPADMTSGDMDCTDMNDDEFETFVEAVKNWPSAQMIA